MPSNLFINLAVTNLDKSVNLYSKMGFTLNPQFSDESAKCLVWSETIFVMLLTHERFATFTTKPIADTKNNIAGLYALSVDSLDIMHQIVNDAVAEGGKEPKPMQDHGFMQLRNVEDFDGHTWEIFYMDMTKFPTE